MAREGVQIQVVLSVSLVFSSWRARLTPRVALLEILLLIKPSEHHGEVLALHLLYQNLQKNKKSAKPVTLISGVFCKKTGVTEFFISISASHGK